jgi:xylan 1,4-beta-xylosidase
MNLFRMLGQMNSERVAAQSSAAINIDDILKSSVRNNSDINVIATRDAHQVNTLVWNYHDDAVSAPPSTIHLVVNGLPTSAAKVLVRHWRVDQHHSNAYATWQSIGSPLDPSATDLQQLQTAGQLQLLDSPEWVSTHQGVVELTFEEPLQGVSLLELSW